MIHNSDVDSTPLPPPSNRYLPIPIHPSFLTYILLVAIVIVWLITEMAGGSTDGRVLVRFGANYGPLILQGEIWRFFTSMFLHVGLRHLGSNVLGLFILGVQMERLYGPDRYLVIYILAGLFGSLASFAFRGPSPIPSAGASGAIFGIVGMDLAFFLLHRKTLGELGRQQIINALMIIGLNLVIGFSVPGIDNMAHLGGLIAGFALGSGLAPRYQVIDQYTDTPRLVDTVSLLKRWWVVILAMILLAVGTQTALSFWFGRLLER